MMVGGSPSLQGIGQALKRKLEGGKRKISGFWPKPNPEDLERIAGWVKEGKVKAVINTKFKFEEAREAFERLKTGRSRGKVVVDAAGENYKSWLYGRA